MVKSHNGALESLTALRSSSHFRLPSKDRARDASFLPVSRSQSAPVFSLSGFYPAHILPGIITKTLLIGVA